MLDRIILEIEKEINQNPFQWARRSTPFWHYKRKDNNLFSLASTLFILQDFVPGKNLQNLKKIILSYYPYYKNKDGRITYNFYPTTPSKHFPNGYVMQYLDHFRLPDDIDDTALVHSTQNSPKAQVEELHHLCQNFLHYPQNTEPVYCTWFGKNMPTETDLCALLNLMYLFNQHQIQYSQIDINTYNYLAEQITNVLHQPFQLSRHYAHPALILYHYTRFITKFSTPLDHIRTTLLQEIHKSLENHHPPMFRILLETSLMKLGEKRPPLNDFSEKDFYTFIGAPLAPFSSLFKWASLPAYQMFWTSKIHNFALIAEYQYYRDA